SKSLNFQTEGSLRWIIASSITGEASGNTGSNLSIYRYSNSGVFLGIALSIARSNGAIIIGSPSGMYIEPNSLNVEGGVYANGINLVTQTTLARNSANTLSTTIESAFAKANTASLEAGGAHLAANAAAVQAASGRTQANTALINSQGAFGKANTSSLEAGGA